MILFKLPKDVTSALSCRVHEIDTKNIRNAKTSLRGRQCNASPKIVSISLQEYTVIPSGIAFCCGSPIQVQESDGGPRFTKVCQQHSPFVAGPRHYAACRRSIYDVAVCYPVVHTHFPKILLVLHFCRLGPFGDPGPFSLNRLNPLQLCHWYATGTPQHSQHIHKYWSKHLSQVRSKYLGYASFCSIEIDDHCRSCSGRPASGYVIAVINDPLYTHLAARNRSSLVAVSGAYATRTMIQALFISLPLCVPSRGSF